MAGKHFMAKAFSNAHGQFKRFAASKGLTTEEAAKKYEHAKGKRGEQARLALVGIHAHHSGAAKKLYPKHPG